MKEKLTKRALFFFALTMLMQTSFATTTSINFIQADHKTVTKLSTLEDKHFFVNYSADWCATCQVMEETSNANPILVDFVEKKFIAVKANVDNEKGKNWQSQFGVTCLPTLIVFSPKGNELERITGSITSSEFLVFLQKFETLPSHSFAVNVKPAAPPSYMDLANETESNITFTEVSTNSSFTTKGESSSPSSFVSNSINYGVQVGMYSDLTNANRKIDKMKKQVKQPVTLRHEKIKEKTMYQVIIGEYSIESDASNYVRLLKSKGIKGYLIEL